MKDTHFLYGVAILAVVGITAVFIAYATDTLPMHTPNGRSISTIPPMKQKKSCSCCSKDLVEMLKKMEKQMQENKDISDIWNEVVDDL